MIILLIVRWLSMRHFWRASLLPFHGKDRKSYKKRCKKHFYSAHFGMLGNTWVSADDYFSLHWAPQGGIATRLKVQ
jgi:hypothetical protein